MRRIRAAEPLDFVAIIGVDSRGASFSIFLFMFEAVAVEFAEVCFGNDHGIIYSCLLLLYSFVYVRVAVQGGRAIRERAAFTSFRVFCDHCCMSWVCICVLSFVFKVNRV